MNVDLWGPKTVKNKNGSDYKILLLTMIYTVTGWFKVAALRNFLKAAEIQRLLDST